MSAETNRDVVRRLVTEFWNNDREEHLETSYAPDYVNHDPAPGKPPDREGLFSTLKLFKSAFTNTTIRIEEIVEEGDTLAWRWRYRADHTGDFMGVPATGKQVAMSGISIFRFRDGKIVEGWNNMDMIGLMTQLGAVPAPG